MNTDTEARPVTLRLSYAEACAVRAALDAECERLRILSWQSRGPISPTAAMLAATSADHLSAILARCYI
jgi:hypothetical protein